MSHIHYHYDIQLINTISLFPGPSCSVTVPLLILPSPLNHTDTLYNKIWTLKSLVIATVKTPYREGCERNNSIFYTHQKKNYQIKEN